MGLLSQGKPLDWDETKKWAKFVRDRGVAQFINVYNKSKGRADGPFKWGDETEYILVKLDHKAKVARVSLKAERVFQRIREVQKGHTNDSVWHPEFAAYMVEATPGVPYGVDGNLVSGLYNVEINMRKRRQQAQAVLEADETIMSITNFPRLGCPNFTHPVCQPRPETSASGSLFFPDEAIFGGHPRFKTLVKNIRARRRRKVIINLPIFKDRNTPSPFIENLPANDTEAKKAMQPDHVYLDAMGFGMGCCCLQLTLQATHLAEAKVLYDQLAPLCPIALALSAASPVYRGYLTDQDCRWNVISRSVDDRTREELNETFRLKESKFRISKSRYDSISLYLSEKGQQFNDLPAVFDKNYYELMVANEVDPAVARHIAHLFIRDPITLYKEKLDQSDKEMDHFENIQSTNWQTMRFKPPPSADSNIGWRVEFRPLEAQTTDFESAAYVVFIVLLSRVILACKLDFLIPLSLVDKNMIEAQKRDAVKDGKFWFRRNITPRASCKEPLSTKLENCCIPKCSSPVMNRTSRHNLRSSSRHQRTTNVEVPILFGRDSPGSTNTSATTNHRNDDPALRPASREGDACVDRMTIDEIINGSEGGFMGIMPIVRHYVDSLSDGSNSELLAKIHAYLNVISDRASLKAKTTARCIRDFIESHPKYAHDSVVNDEVAYDLLQIMDKIGKEEIPNWC